jgi:hypothetical protein
MYSPNNTRRGRGGTSLQKLRPALGMNVFSVHHNITHAKAHTTKRLLSA